MLVSAEYLKEQPTILLSMDGPESHINSADRSLYIATRCSLEKKSFEIVASSF